jgi:hypothetical protein
MADNTFQTALQHFPDLEFLQVEGFEVSSIDVFKQLFLKYHNLVLICHSQKMYFKSRLTAVELVNLKEKLEECSEEKDSIFNQLRSFIRVD